MSILKEQLIKWTQALEEFDGKRYESALEIFVEFQDTAKIYYNTGVILMALGKSDSAVKQLTLTVKQDPWFAAGYFQRGAVLFMNDDIEGALEDYQDCYEKLRENTHIDYTQLGLDYVLQECYVIFNIALCFLVLGDYDRGLRYFEQALASSRDASIQPDTYKIEEALRRGEDAVDMLPYEISISLIFRPQEDNVKNAKKVNYLGKSKVVAGSDSKDSFAGFSGRQHKEMTLGRDYRKKKELAEEPPAPRLPEFSKRTITRRTSSVTKIEVPKTRITSRSSSISTPRSRKPSASSPFSSPLDSPKSRKTSDSSTYPRRPFDPPISGRRLVDSPTGTSRRPFDSPTEMSRRPFDSPVESPPTPPTSSSSTSSYDDDMVSQYPNSKFRIKAHYKSSVRILKIPTTSNFDDLLDALEEKLKTDVRVEFKVDGELVEMGDDDDFDEAVELSVGNKIELFCEDL